MKFKKAIVTGTVAAAFVGSVLNVSAAEMTTKDYMNALKKDGKESLIVDVEAYKAAYSDLAAAFGDDWGAYIEHYLTFGVYEGRMEGALFDPITYAEAYGDIKAAYGDNILAIANHYVTVGAAENRTIGTSGGYADIAAAEKAGAVVSVPRVTSQVNGNVVNGSAAVNAENPSGSDGSILNSAEDEGEVNGGNNAPGAVNNSGSAAVTNNAGTVVNSSASGDSSVNSNADSSAANTSVNTASTTANNSAAANINTSSEKNYHHTTSIYHDDGDTLWRVEYYDENNKLSEYSSVTDVDNSTNSYTENVYKWDEEKNESVLQRTDTYVNGELVSSEKS